MVDRQLNYGRDQIQELARNIEEVVGSILDLGAGSGNDLLNLQTVFPEAKLHGLESFPENVEILKRNHINCIQMDIERETLPFDNGSIDLIVTNQFLEHTKDIFWIMHEASRVLADGGSLLIGVPNLASLHNRILLLLGRQPTCIQAASAHVRGFTRSDLLKMLEAVFPGGYKLVDFKGCNFYPFPPRFAKPLARLLPDMAWGMALHFKKVKRYERQFLEFPIKEKLETNFFLGN